MGTECSASYPKRKLSAQGLQDLSVQKVNINVNSRSSRYRTKRDPPGFAKAFLRHRLFAMLDAMSDQPCIWIVAPGGYGKTCLLRSYVEVGRRPSIWHNLDSGDSDVVTFFADFSDSLEAAGYAPLPRLTPDVQILSRFSCLYFQQLAEKTDSPTLLILDDYHRVAADSGLHEGIAAAIEHLPASIRLVILSRERPPPGFARAQAHLQLGLIGADELALTETEALGMARQVMDEQVPDEAILEARLHVGGWIAGFMVMLAQSDLSSIEPESVTTLFRYFGHEVLNHTPVEIRPFLWQTALFGNFSAEMADRLTGQNGSAGILRRLVNGNYFLQADQSARPVYHYHDLFRDYLLEYGRHKHAAEWKVAARRAANILAEVDEPHAAASLYAEIADWRELARLINRYGGRLLKRGSHRTLAQWLSLMPAELMDQQPWLIYWHGCSRLSTDPKYAREQLRRAFALFVRDGDRHGALLSWAAVCQAYWIAFDDMRPLAGWLNELDTVWSGNESGLPSEIEAQVDLGAFLCLIVVRPDDPALGYWEGRLTRLLADSSNPDLNAMAATLLMFHFVWTVGDRGRAHMLRQMLHTAESSLAVAPMTLVIARSWGDFSYEYGFGGSLPRCLESLHAAKDLADARGIHLYDATLYGGIAYCQLTSGQIDEARQSLDQMEKTLNLERTYDTGFYLWLREWEAWLDGRYTEAMDLGRQENAYADRFGFMHPWPMSHLAAAQISNSLGQRAQALRHLAKIGRWARRTQSRIGTYIRGLALAQFSMESGRRERLRRILQITLPLGQVEGYVGPPFFRPADLTKLCSEALSAGIAKDYISRVIRNRGLPAPQKAESSEHWPWPVKVRVLGEFRLVLDGTPYVRMRKAQQKPLELLEALVALGGVAIPQEKLADMLWPDADGDAAARNFKTTLSRLRKLLGQHDYLVVRGSTLSLNREYCWTDLWRLHELASDINAKIRFAGDPPPVDTLKSLADRLQNAYSQPLLVNGRDAWVPAARNLLHERYLRCIRKLAHSMEYAGTSDLAAALRASAVVVQD